MMMMNKSENDVIMNNAVVNASLNNASSRCGLSKDMK